MDKPNKQFSTDELTNGFLRTKDFKRYMNNHADCFQEQSLQDHLEHLLQEKGLKRSDVIQRASLDRARVCTEQGQLCVLREYIEDETLADTSHRFSAEETVRIALQLYDVLSYLHCLTPPLIHRDVKPENILLRSDGTVVLIDFGIACLYSNQGEKDTCIMGTEHFAPPEQYVFRQTDCRSDLYALGMVMGWMLTGSILSEDYSSISNKRLCRIIKKCAALKKAAA